MLNFKRISTFGSAELRRVFVMLAVVMLGVSPSLAKVNGTGDFNGDGFADLCIGVITFNVGSTTAAGGVNCLYGSATGLQATGTPKAQLWTQDSTGLAGVSETGDQFGAALAVGDFNGDGFDDICIGAPHDGVSGKTDAGAVNCIYGSASGLQATGVGGPHSQLWDENTTGVKGGLGKGDLFGFALISGDFDHDGFADLCIGVAAKTVSGHAGAGAVNCLYGSASGLQATGTGGRADQFWNQDTNGVGGIAQANDNFGSALVAADFNGDGFDDLCTGVPGESIGSVATAGGVNCLYGSSKGLQAIGSLGPASQFWSQNSTSVKNDSDAGEGFGGALAAGDFNHDGFMDLAIGSADNTDAFNAGGVNILYGSATGLQATGTGGPDDQFWSRNSTSVKGSAGDGFCFGCALTAGDFNQDGFDDLCMGVSADSSIVPIGGAVNCLYGSASGLQATGTGGPDDQLWNQDTTGVIGTPEDTDSFGWSVAAGDFNGDGFFDLAVGVPGENNLAGGINVIYGSTTGLQATGTGGPGSQFWRQGSDGVPGTGGGHFGQALSH